MKKLLLLSLLSFFLNGCSKEATPGTTNMEINNLPTEFKALFNVFDGQGIGAAVNLNDDIMLFFSSDGQQYAWFEDQEIKKVASINKEDGLFDGLAFSTIGSAIDFEEEKLVFFNKVGATYQWVGLDPDMVKGGSNNNTLFSFANNTYSLWEWGEDYGCPFDKIGSMLGFSKEPLGCTEIGDDDDFMWMVNDDGDELSLYTKSSAVFNDPIEIEEWRYESVCGGAPSVFPINSIGAVCVYEPDGEDYKELFFNEDGDEMVVLNGTKGTFSEVFKIF